MGITDLFIYVQISDVFTSQNLLGIINNVSVGVCYDSEELKFLSQRNRQIKDRLAKVRLMISICQDRIYRNRLDCLNPTVLLAHVRHSSFSLTMHIITHTHRLSYS